MLGLLRILEVEDLINAFALKNVKIISVNVKIVKNCAIQNVIGEIIV